MGAKDAHTTASDGDVLLIDCPLKSPILPKTWDIPAFWTPSGVHPLIWREVAMETVCTANQMGSTCASYLKAQQKLFEQHSPARSPKTFSELKN